MFVTVARSVHSQVWEMSEEFVSGCSWGWDVGGILGVQSEDAL